jgi:hypothetical protein
LDVYPETGIKNLTEANGFKNIHQIQVGNGKFKTLQSDFGGSCVVTFVVSDTVSIDVTGLTFSTDSTQTCKLATLMAQAAEPNIPTS